jgi:hypothetical protein
MSSINCDILLEDSLTISKLPQPHRLDQEYNLLRLSLLMFVCFLKASLSHGQ